MSYILEAIRKAEREQELKQQTEWEEDQVPPPGIKPIQFRQYWKILINLMLILNLLIWAILFWPKPPVSPPVIEFKSN